jgi:hypothetical protein
VKTAIVNAALVVLFPFILIAAVAFIASAYAIEAFFWLVDKATSSTSLGSKGNPNE